MSNEIVFSKKYKPIFELLDGKHEEVDTVIITGGRGSAKSFVLSLFSIIGLVKNKWSILYTRYTNVSIVDSIKPEVESKISLLGYENFIDVTTTHLVRKQDKKDNLEVLPRIAFKGIKTGSQQQTANLKSLFGFNIFVVDEAEEIPDFDTYEKVFLSIRSKEHRNITFLILNPTTVFHWIYKKFFEECEVTGGSNIVKDNVMYIHTSYLDVKKEYLAKNIIKYYEKLKDKFPKRYESIVKGGWTDTVEGRVYTGWKTISVENYEKLNFTKAYAIDWGKSDPFAILEGKYDKYNNKLYLHELHYLSENNITDNADDNTLTAIRNNGGVIPYVVRKLNLDKNKYAVCDSAVQDNIYLLNEIGFENAYGVKKGDGSILSGVQRLQSTEVIYTTASINLEKEYSLYCHAKDRMGFIKDKFEDKNNHLMDCARYLRQDFDGIIEMQ